ncbi:MAG: sulfur carrier protein ThiS [Planctomycetaceae bacterium]
MQISINGESRTIPTESTVADLLKELEMQSKYVAVERNLELVPRAIHGDCRLEDGDQLEIVTLVGGG